MNKKIVYEKIGEDKIRVTELPVGTESFVNFNQSNATNYGNTIYVPQYSSNDSRKVISLYDNIYIDNVNGNLLEIDGLACNKGNVISGNTDCVDNYGTTITNIYVATRDAINVM